MHLLAPYFEPYAKQEEEQDRLRAAFAHVGVQYVPWCALNDDALPACDAIFWQGISTYYVRQDRFAQLLDMADAAGVRSINTTSLIRWNADKQYLRTLEAAGVPIVPTHWLERFDATAIAAWAAQQNVAEYIVKPAVSAGAYLTFRVADAAGLAKAEAAYADAPDQPVMLQPFAQEILDDGEWSFIFFGGRLSHCVNKRAKDGDYRIQHTHGGHYAKVEPAPELLEQAKAVLSVLPETPVYARVDGIRRNGNLLLMEVELIEPYLYLDAHPEGLSMLTKAVAAL